MKYAIACLALLVGVTLVVPIDVDAGSWQRAHRIQAKANVAAMNASMDVGSADCSGSVSAYSMRGSYRMSTGYYGSADCSGGMQAPRGADCSGGGYSAPPPVTNSPPPVTVRTSVTPGFTLIETPPKRVSIKVKN
jgi:hypothetical protein